MLAVTLVCVGRLKGGSERDLTGRYVARAQLAGRAVGLAFGLRELDESRARRPEDRQADEAKAIVAAIGPLARVVALDETGASIGSADFAAFVGATRDDGIGNMAIVVGGPDGLDPTFRAAAARTIAFGAMTWPHQLARIMAAEQMYRAATILAGHPYHRA